MIELRLVRESLGNVDAKNRSSNRKWKKVKPQIGQVYKLIDRSGNEELVKMLDSLNGEIVFVPIDVQGPSKLVKKAEKLDLLIKAFKMVGIWSLFKS